MNILELSARSNLRQNAQFYQAIDARAAAFASNPALVATPAGRSPLTGEVTLTTPDGGSVRGKYIGNSSLSADTPAPAFTRGAGTGFVDAKVVR